MGVGLCSCRNPGVTSNTNIATYIEERKMGFGVSRESSSRKEDKGKGNGKKSNSTSRREENLSCKHYKK
jgi:hypothetical protein